VAQAEVVEPVTTPPPPRPATAAPQPNEPNESSLTQIVDGTVALVAEVLRLLT
jgi:hypothetical protein